MALPGTERAEPKHLKEDLPDHNFRKEKSAFIRSFLLQITFLWEQNSDIAINHEHCSHHNTSLNKTVSDEHTFC